MRFLRISIIISILLLLLIGQVSGCTIFVVTQSASSDGSVFVGHTNDGLDAANIAGLVREDMVTFAYVPAADHPPGALREIIYDPNSGGEFHTEGAMPTDRIVIGTIPQVPHTYGYLTSAYAIMNEHQLISGECTDFAKVHPDAEEGKRIFYSSDLSNIAMERCRTAREAVEMVGWLIDTYGYYGTGETLIFADPDDAWVIEMCGGTPDGTGGYWAAQQIRDGEVFVAANQFRIREIRAGAPDQIHSDNLYLGAYAMGWWKPSDGPLDFAKVFGAGEYSHPYYSQSRVWRIYDMIAPSLELSPFTEGPFSKEYPFSVTPDKPIDTKKAFSLFRDHYEGTVFDLTAHPAGGAYGNPYRNWGPFDAHDRLADGELKPGAWPRPLSTDPCGYSYVAQARGSLPAPIGGVAWIGLSSPAETCYAPFYAGINSIPDAYQRGSHWEMDMESAFWPFEFVQNWARLMYAPMSHVIREEQGRLEGDALARQAKIESEAVALYQTNQTAATEYLTNYTIATAEELLDAWRALGSRLVVTFRNGQYNDVQNRTIISVGYPEWWYEGAKYQYGPRVYPVDELRVIPGVIYTGNTTTVPDGDMISYIARYQVKV